jgi:zinc protease
MPKVDPIALSSAARRVSKGVRTSFDTHFRFARMLLRTNGILLLVLLIALPARAIDIKQVKSPGGIEAWLVEDRSVPVVSLSVAFRGGAALDPANKGGLAEMTASLLDEGAGDLDSQAFHRAVEDIAASLSFGAGRDNFSASVYTLASERARAFELFRMALTSPRFDPEPVARVRAQIIAGLRRSSEQPNRIAAETFAKTMFPDHPYGRPVRGTPESVAAITVEEMRELVKARLARANIVVGVVGDIGPEELARRLDEIFAPLPEEPKKEIVPEVEPKGLGRTVVVKRPIPQSVVVFGEKGLKRADPDWYAAVVMNRVLGEGGFASRLMEEVREKRGLAYGVSTSLVPYERSALIIGNVGTRNDQIKETIAIIRAEWQRMAEGGATDREIANAKTYINGSFPLRLDSSRRIADTLVSVQLDRLGIDYLNKRSEIINAVTKDDVARVAKRLLIPEDLTWVIVGDPEGIAPSP